MVVLLQRIVLQMGWKPHYFMLAFKGAVYDIVLRTGSVVCIKKFQMNQRRSLFLYVFDLCWRSKSNQNFSIINTLLWPMKTTLFQGPNLLSKGKESELEWGCKVYVVSKSSHTVNESLDSGGRLLWFETQLYIGQVIKSLCFSFLVYKMGIVILLIGCPKWWNKWDNVLLMVSFFPSFLNKT